MLEGKLLDTPCTAGARSAIDWSERVKNREYIGRRCTENGLQRILKIHFYFDRDATNVNSVDFKGSKRVQKGGPKTGPWTDRYYSLIPYKEGQLLRSEKSMCQNATFYGQCPPLHFPFAKSNYFPDERNETNETNEQILVNLILRSRT